MLGFGLGYGFLALKKHCPNTPILIIENDLKGFKTALSLIDFSNFFQIKNNIFFIGKKLDDLEGHFSSEFHFHFGYDGIKFINHPVLTQIYPDYYRKTASMITKQLRAHGTEIGSFMVHHHEIVKNFLYNCASSKNEIQLSSIKNKLSDCPAFIIGAGPSLTESLEALFKIQSHGIVIATDTSVSPLLAAGIIPDFIVALDYTKNNLNHFKPIFHHLKSIPLIACYSLYYEIVRDYPGPVGWFATDNPVLAHFKSESSSTLTNELASGTALGIELANFLGASPIIFIGQDLSYRPDFLYAADTQKKQIILEKDGQKFLADAQSQSRISSIRTVDGYSGPVETSIEMETMIRNIYHLTTQDHPNTYYNFNSQGAILESTIQLTNPIELKQLASSYLKKSIPFEIKKGSRKKFMASAPEVIEPLSQSLFVANEIFKIIDRNKNGKWSKNEADEINRSRETILGLPYVVAFTEYVNFSRSFLLHKKELKDKPNLEDQISMNRQFFLMVFEGSQFLIHLLNDILNSENQHPTDGRSPSQ